MALLTRDWEIEAPETGAKFSSTSLVILSSRAFNRPSRITQSPSCSVDSIVAVTDDLIRRFMPNRRMNGNLASHQATTRRFFPRIGE